MLFLVIYWYKVPSSKMIRNLINAHATKQIKIFRVKIENFDVYVKTNEVSIIS